MGVLLLPGHAVHACSVCRMLRDASPRHPRRSEVGMFDRKDNRGSALLRGTQWWSIPLPFSLFGRIRVADDLRSTNTLAIMLSLFLCASSGVMVLVTRPGGRGVTMDGNVRPRY